MKRYNNASSKLRYSSVDPVPHQPPRDAQDLPESVSFEDLEKMDESHARFLKRKKQLALPKLPKIGNARGKQDALSQSVDPMSFRNRTKNINEQSQDMQGGAINAALYQSYDRPVRPDMRADGASERPARRQQKGADADTKVQQPETDNVTMLSSQANTMANFMKFVDQKPDEGKDKKEDPWQLGSDDTEPEQAEMPRQEPEDGAAQADE